MTTPYKKIEATTDTEEFMTRDTGIENTQEDNLEWTRPPEVVSEINTFLVSSSDVKPIVKPSNRIAKLVFSQPCQIQNHVKNDLEEQLKLDKDGDVILNRRSTSNDIHLFIEYENSTTLDLVGLQIWRGALLLADYIIHNSSLFQDKVVLELGSGTGLSSVVTSFYASKVIATDLNEPNILNLIKANVEHNRKYVRSEFLVKPLDFTNLVWSKDLEESIYETDLIIAADVVYHNKITEAFVQSVGKFLSTGKPKNVFIALEKRYVFTVSDLDVSAPMYDNFMDQLQSILALSPSLSAEEEASLNESPCLTSTKTEMERSSSISAQYNLILVPTDFPQYFNYERTKELVIWNIQPKKI